MSWPAPFFNPYVCLDTIEDGSNGDTATDHYHRYMVLCPPPPPPLKMQIVSKEVLLKITVQMPIASKECCSDESFGYL
jgi:hypothetical protein